MSSEPPAAPSERRDEPPEPATRPVPPPIKPPSRPPALGPRELPLGRLVLGGILLVGGILWLLGSLDVISDLSLTAILAVALIVVGLALGVGSRTGRHSGLITAGAILTVVLALASTFNLRIEGGAGERTFRPASLADLPDTYQLGVGQLTVDLRDLLLPRGTTQLEITLGIGQLVVNLPADAEVRVHGRAGAGQVAIFDREHDGFDVDATESTAGYANAPARLLLDVSVGLGQVDVNLGTSGI
jgi:hypothetical protein